MKYLKDNYDLFTQQIDRLEKGLKGQYTQGQLEVLYNQIKHFKTSYLVDAVTHCLSTKMFLPPVNDVVICCRIESYGDHENEKEEEKKFARKFFDGEEKFEGMAKESARLIRDVLTTNREDFFLKESRPFDKSQLHEKMVEMEKRFPGVGWRREADKLKAERS